MQVSSILLVLTVALITATTSTAQAAVAAMPTTPSVHWSVQPRMTGDGVAPSGVVLPRKAVVSINACPAPRGVVEYQWAGADTKTGAPLEFSAPDPDADLPKKGREPVGVPCATKTYVDWNTSANVTLRVRDRSNQTSAPRGVVVTPRDYLIVSVGDSYASGEGAPMEGQRFDALGFVSRGPVWSDRRCHRSANAGPSLAASTLERTDPHSSITYVHLACSGAAISGIGPFGDGSRSLPSSFGRLNLCQGVRPAGSGTRGGFFDCDNGKDPFEDRGWTIDPQLQQLQAIAARRPIDALTMSFGGNDSGFAPFAMACATDVLVPFSKVSCIDDLTTSRPTSTCPSATSGLLADVCAAVGLLPAKLDAVKRALDPLVPPSKVYATGYPDLLGGACCAGVLLAGISPAEAKWSRDNLLDPMNRALADPKRQWNYVDLVGPFTGHAASADSFLAGLFPVGPPATQNRWINWFSDSLINQGPIPPTCSKYMLSLLNLGLTPTVAAAGVCAAGLLAWTQPLTDYLTAGVLHPNRDGQAAISDALVAQIRPRLAGFGT